MGEVYAAKDPRLNRIVALKVLTSSVAPDPERVARFRREAQAVAALNHPNIVTIYSVEEHDGIPFLTMELVQGKTLAEHMKAGGMALDALLRLALGVTDALVAAHARGIVHRDIKPANIMITNDGHLKVLDFGLAKLLETKTGSDNTTVALDRLTGEAGIVGTIDYMSPEQAEGKPADHRSDVFSFGVVLYQMASGARPFTGATPISVITSILRDTPARLADTRAECPPALSRIVHRCLEKDPARRYQDTRDLRNDLEEVQRDITEPVRRSSSESVEKRIRRPIRYLGAALVFIAMAIGGAAYLARLGWSDTRATNEFEVDKVALLTTQGRASTAVVSPDGRYVAHVTTIEGKPSLWMRQTVGTSDIQIVRPPKSDIRV
jgi:serine/threonine protein kinase